MSIRISGPAPEKPQTQQDTVEKNVQSPDSFEPNVAATKIQRAFRLHQVRKERPIKKIIQDTMEEVATIIEKSSSADKVNKTPIPESAIKSSHRNFYYRVMDLQKTRPVVRFSGFIDDREGNCQECAELLRMCLKENTCLDPKLKQQIRLCRLAKPDDHAFVIIGDINSPECMVLDPWIKYLNLPAKKGFRKKESAATERKRGFLGTKTEYLDFIRSHEDGEFIKVGGHHVFGPIESNIPDDKFSEILSYTDKRLKSKLPILNPISLERTAAFVNTMLSRSRELTPQHISEVVRVLHDKLDMDSRLVSSGILVALAARDDNENSKERLKRLMSKQMGCEALYNLATFYQSEMFPGQMTTQESLDAVAKGLESRNEYPDDWISIAINRMRLESQQTQLP